MTAEQPQPSSPAYRTRRRPSARRDKIAFVSDARTLDGTLAAAEAAGDPPIKSCTHPRLALLALAIGGFAIGTTEFVSMGLLPNIARGVDVSIPAAGHAVSTYALGVVVGAPLLAILGARMSRYRLLLWLMAAFTVGNLASALAPSYHALLVARFAAGLPHGAFFGIGAVVGRRWSHRIGGRGRCR